MPTPPMPSHNGSTFRKTSQAIAYSGRKAPKCCESVKRAMHRGVRCGTHATEALARPSPARRFPAFRENPRPARFASLDAKDWSTDRCRGWLPRTNRRRDTRARFDAAVGFLGRTGGGLGADRPRFRHTAPRFADGWTCSIRDSGDFARGPPFDGAWPRKRTQRKIAMERREDDPPCTRRMLSGNTVHCFHSHRQS